MAHDAGTEEQDGAGPGLSRRGMLASSGLGVAGGLTLWGTSSAAAAAPAAPAAEAGTTVSFQLTVATSTKVPSGPGRAFVIIAKASDLDATAPEPRNHVQGDEPLNVPIFGKDVGRMRPGTPITLGAGNEVVGYPLESVTDIPSGDYVVQGFWNTYETNRRSDGSVVQVHWPSGDGGNVWDSPGNVYSTPRTIHIGPRRGTVRLTLDQVIAPIEPIPAGGTGQQGNPVDSAHVKHIKIRSTLLSDYWGRDVFLGADILLPHGYDDNPHQRYPMELVVGHYPRRNPHSFSEALDNDFSKWWVSDKAARLIAVQVRSENPFYDDSYNVNSANLGPYGDAINRELIGEIDRRFRTIGRRWARTTWGGSTGGWIAAASLIFYPDVYAGAWAGYPDSLDFRAHQVINVYEDENAYVTQSSWETVPRPSARTATGDTIFTNGMENAYERAAASRTRSQGQWDIWTAVFGPQGPDGYPAPIWDKSTGVIDPKVAASWKANFDLSEQLRSRWADLGRKVAGRLHVYVGTEDTYFLNAGVTYFEQVVAALAAPKADCQFIYGVSQRHGWSPCTPQEMLTTMAAFVAEHAPASADTRGWRGKEKPPALMLRRGRQVVDVAP